MISTPTVDNLIAPSLQAVVTEQVQQLRNGDHNPGPSFPQPLSASLTSLSLMHTGDPVCPVTSLGLQEDARRTSLPMATIDIASVPTPFFQPLGLVMESPQVAQALEGMVESIFSHLTFLQAPWSLNHIAADYKLVVLSLSEVKD
ncbi:hypothetical protein AAF712_016538, partial [Marasmius tenuissimus]